MHSGGQGGTSFSGKTTLREPRTARGKVKSRA